MSNILSYINTFTNVLFGIDLLYSPSQCISDLTEMVSEALAAEKPFFYFLTFLLGSLPLLFSLVVWVFFAYLTIYLLLIGPFKWLRSVIRKCRLS